MKTLTTYGIRSFLVVLIAIMTTGCATNTSTIKFNQSEIRLIPTVAMPRVLSSNATNETVKIKARHINGSMDVKRIEGPYVIATDKHGNEMKLTTSEITEIERIRWINRPKPSGKNKTTEAIGETLTYAPLIPVAIVSIPFLNAMGLDAKVNAEDNEKSRLVYEGMSKEELETYIGKPKEKYYCDNRRGYPANEIWVYEKHQVLRGGRALFINLEKNKVYHNSYGVSFFKNKDTCSLITK